MASFDIFASPTFANNPIRSNSDQVKPSFALDFLNKAISLDGSGTPSSQKLLAKVLPFSNGRPLVRSSDPVEDSDDPPIWYLAWLLPSEFSGVPVSEDSFVYLGSMSMEDVDCGTTSQTIHWAVDISNQTPEFLQLQGTSLGSPGAPSSFVDLRTLMVATDWSDQNTMAQLAIAGHVSSLSFAPILITLHFGTHTILMRRRQSGKGTAGMASHVTLLRSLRIHHKTH